MRSRIFLICLWLAAATCDAADSQPPATAAEPDPTQFCPGAAAFAKEHYKEPTDGDTAGAAPTRPELAAELRAMTARDQTVRFAALAAPQTDPEKISAMISTDAMNLKRLKEIVAASGFPTRAMVGRQGVQDAWLLTQHADSDPPFQKQILAVLKSWDSGDVRLDDLALLEDRVLVHEGKLQRYGSQFTEKDGVLQAQPIEDPAHVDERRAKMNLMPMADYTCVLQHMRAQPAHR